LNASSEQTLILNEQNQTKTSSIWDTL